ncbi:hypothetical protein MRB53_036867 [Persea americana]|nr:hypothetical protein MRB53_036867 [Persea americana]
MRLMRRLQFERRPSPSYRRLDDAEGRAGLGCSQTYHAVVQRWKSASRALQLPRRSALGSAELCRSVDDIRWHLRRSRFAMAEHRPSSRDCGEDARASRNASMLNEVAEDKKWARSPFDASWIFVSASLRTLLLLLGSQLAPHTKSLPFEVTFAVDQRVDSPQNLTSTATHISAWDDMDIRPLRASDLPSIQHANISNLPENYFLKYYLYHLQSWPSLSYVAVVADNSAKAPKIVGYVLAKLSEDDATTGHITSLSVLRPYRRLHLAERLIRQSLRAMREYYGATNCSLHVRQSNKAAIGLYMARLGFERRGIEAGYYADGEDAWGMGRDLRSMADEEGWDEEAADEGDAVGDEGQEKKRKVKMGRGLGVGALVERDERSQAVAT